MNIKQLGSNQTLLKMGNNEILFSYNTPVAGFIDGKGYVRVNKFYSVTTSKHINKYLDGIEAQEVTPEYFNQILGD